MRITPPSPPDNKTSKNPNKNNKNEAKSINAADDARARHD